ncbi:hypothetical protein FS837_001993 [Tulasnella sp. UAMH 9824]|nr:hypothetical protein FS837_001993 [Tulasnella sp. UAMH 9824]
MEIVLSAIDLQVLPDLLDIMGMDELRFDRVETSNVMDTLGPAEIISTWGPRLNCRNPCSTLLMYSMNWAFHISGGRADVQEPNRMMDTMAELVDYLGVSGEGKPAKPPPFSLLTNNIGAFFDTRPPFQRYLHQNGVTIASRLFGVHERKEPRILPARFGVEISEFDSPKITITPEQFYFAGHILFPSWHERFVEFEVVKEPIPEIINSVGQEPILEALSSGEKEPMPEIIGPVGEESMPELVGFGGEEAIPEPVGFGGEAVTSELVGSAGKEPMPEILDSVAKEPIPEVVGSVGKEPIPEDSGFVENKPAHEALSSFFVPSAILWPIGVLLMGYLMRGYVPPSL